MKRVFPILLLLSIFLPALGQSNNVSYVDKDLEAKLVRVFEWVLDGRFSPTQRAELSQQIDNNMRSSNPADRQSLEDVAKLDELIDTIPPEKRAEAHAEIQAKILEQLRKQPNDPTAKLLLSVYNNGRSTTTLATSHTNAATQSLGTEGSTGLPAELIGEWQARRGSGSSYYNPNLGSYGAPNATIDSYKFFADGHYEHSILMQNSLYNCTIRVFGWEQGKTYSERDTLTIAPGPGTLEYTDTCRPHLNSKKATQMDQQQWQWKIERDQNGSKLCVRDEQGASACYFRQ